MMMRSILFLILFFLSSMQADVVIDTKLDKTSLSIDQTLAVDIHLSYPNATPPELFSFFYELMKEPLADWKIISFSVSKPVLSNDATSLSLHFSLSPMHTGALIFAPGIISFANKNYLVPAVTADCISTIISSLPLGSLLPLYPERRIELNSANRLALMDEKVLEKAKFDNQLVSERYKIAWDALVWVIATLAFSLLILWAIFYYRLFEQTLGPVTIVQTPLEQLVQQLELPSKIPDGWEKIAKLVREALSVKESRDFQNWGLFELADFVASSEKIPVREKNFLLPYIKKLGDICYAGKRASEQEYQEMKANAS